MESISNSEWEVMRVLWTLKSASANEIVLNLEQTKWQPNTIKTLITRLTKKQVVGVDKSHRPQIYYPLVQEEQMMNQAVVDLFQHLCAMKQGAALINLVKQINLSQADLQTLKQLLSQKEKTAPQTIACNCLKGTHCTQ